MGPVLVTADDPAVRAPQALAMRMWVNGELRHDFSTAHMDRGIPQVISDLSKVLTLEPGDVVSTGTHHQVPPDAEVINYPCVPSVRFVRRLRRLTHVIYETA